MGLRLRQVLPHGVMLVVSALLYWAAARIEGGGGGRIGPDAWPKAIIVFMGLLCAYEVVKRLLAKENREVGSVVEIETPLKPESDNPRMLAWGIGLVAAYVLVVPWIGFFVATTVFLAVFPLAAGFRRPGLTAVIGLIGGLLLVFIFMRVAYISLPPGAGPFRELSFALMRLLGVS